MKKRTHRMFVEDIMEAINKVEHYIKRNLRSQQC